MLLSDIKLKTLRERRESRVLKMDGVDAIQSKDPPVWNKGKPRFSIAEKWPPGLLASPLLSAEGCF